MAMQPKPVGGHSVLEFLILGGLITAVVLSAIAYHDVSTNTYASVTYVDSKATEHMNVQASGAYSVTPCVASPGGSTGVYSPWDTSATATTSMTVGAAGITFSQNGTLQATFSAVALCDAGVVALNLHLAENGHTDHFQGDEDVQTAFVRLPIDFFGGSFHTVNFATAVPITEGDVIELRYECSSTTGSETCDFGSMGLSLVFHPA